MATVQRDAAWKAYVGGRVSVDGKGEGVLCFFGTTATSKGLKKCGVRLDEANGKHNGRVNGRTCVYVVLVFCC